MRFVFLILTEVVMKYISENNTFIIIVEIVIRKNDGNLFPSMLCNPAWPPNNHHYLHRKCSIGQ